MREILFRGKIAKCDWEASIGKWMYGELSTDYDGNYWVGNAYDGYMVDPNTLGQYTGVEDKNGVRIFEGDILQNLVTKHCYEVKWYQDECKFHCIDTESSTAYILDRVMTEHSLVVGNIYDKESDTP